MIQNAEKNWILYGYDQLTAAGVDLKNAQKEMDSFYKQIDLDTKSASSSSDTVDKNEFEVVISSDEEDDNEEENENEDFVIENE